VASGESARGIRTRTSIEDVRQSTPSQARACIFRDAARISEGRRTSVQPVPDHPAVVERRRSGGVLKPSDALGQHDFLRERWTAGE
jgi:hypothetical protein